MTYVGVDSALTVTGLFAFKPGDWYRYQLVKPKKLRGPARLRYIQSEARAFLSDLPCVTYAAIENGSFGSDGRLYQLGGVQHILQLELWDVVSHSVAEVAPAQLKKFQTGKSGAQKEWMLEAANTFITRNVSYGAGDAMGVRDWSPTRIVDDNVADALGLARIAYAMHTEDVTTRAEAEVVVALQKSKHVHEVP